MQQQRPSQNLSALVTGGSRGIGRVIATQLAARGVRIALHYRNNREAAAAALAALPGEGHILFDADLADPTATTRLWSNVMERAGRVDILINNAGVYISHPPLSTEYAAWQGAWQLTLSANLVGPANLSYLAARHMNARIDHGEAFGRGRIVNISSRGAFRGEPDCPAYAASKAGLNAFSQSLAKALAPRAIYVYCIAPGWVATEMAESHLSGPNGPDILAQHPLGRVNETDEIAAATVYCALDAPPAMTGGIIDVNGASYLRA
jgi:3-oxoacyl-[acyl-carrier protein] reductase